MTKWTSILLNKRKFAMVIGIVPILVAVGTIAIHAAPQLAATAAPQKVDKAVPKQERAIALGEEDVKQLVLLMDTDKSGKISRKEFMDFMAAEFARLDKDKSGELDVKELSQSRIRSSAPPAVGK